MFKAISKFLAFALLWWVVQMPGKSYQDNPPPLTPPETEAAGRLQKHLTVLSAEIGERNMKHYDKLCQAQDYIAKQFQSAGLTVSFQEYEVNGKKARNIIAEIKGEKGKGYLVIGAHYDTVPRAPGADDNGTGVAALLELARSLAHTHPKVGIRLVAFVNEERPYAATPLMGSYVYAKACHDAKDKITGMISLETIGYYSQAKGSQKYPFPLSLLYPDKGNFIAFVGNTDSLKLLYRAIGAFRKCATIPSEGLAAPNRMPNIDRSDHRSFWHFGYPAIMVTDTADFRNANYHKPTDTTGTISLPELTRVVEGLEHCLRELSSHR